MNYDLEKVLNDIRTLPTVAIWPHLGMALGISRGAAFAMVRSGQAETITIGTKRKKVVSAWLRKKLHLGDVNERG